MAPLNRLWACITYALNYLSFSSFHGMEDVQQRPVLLSPTAPHHVISTTEPHHISSPVVEISQPKYPIFKPPGGRVGDGPGSDFECEYPAMVGWESCSTPENRACWLREKASGRELNIHTNYEDIQNTPNGTVREYWLDLRDHKLWNADGRYFNQSKLFNESYPGPWIQGCWGDTITVHVTNNLKHNGTSIHWHGIRQWKTMHMDGVNGVTQCPIAPGDTFTYSFRVMQYGSAWYHSHYSVQYADGALGPLTLHGPTWLPYDEAKTPTLMTDWGHNSGFEAMFPGNSLLYNNILLNGTGNVTRYSKAPIKNETEIPTPYTLHFDDHLVPIEGGKTRPKRYLLRIINTAFDSTLVFSIDNHTLQVVGADFVPIHNYTTDHILVGIGQRYHVIVEAEPSGNFGDGNFWIRTWRADCFRFDQTQAAPGYETTGILRYNKSSTATPNTQPWPSVVINGKIPCRDELPQNLVPIIPWQVGVAKNRLPNQVGEIFGVDAKSSNTMYPLAIFSMAYGEEFMPLRVDYDNPTFMNLNNTSPWNPQWVVIPENYTDNDWVYMVIKGRKTTSTVGAHPIHLHGHDFAILQQIEGTSYPDKLNLKYDNPPRRDVVLLPTNGYVVIAFKADNPGVWLVHCHIAEHAGYGLAMQILERQTDAINIWPDLSQSPALRTCKAGCDKWNKWWANCNNWWSPDNDHSTCSLGGTLASPDSGI